MYKSPKPSGGGSGFLMLLFLLWGAFYLSGCADMATSPAFDEFEEVEELPSPTVELGDLELTIDPDIVMAVIADVEAELGPNPSAVALNEIQDAVGLFQMAQVEYSNGNYQQVQVLGEAARMALSRSLMSERGTDGIDDRIARIDNLRTRKKSVDGSFGSCRTCVRTSSRAPGATTFRSTARRLRSSTDPTPRMISNEEKCGPLSDKRWKSSTPSSGRPSCSNISRGGPMTKCPSCSGSRSRRSRCAFSGLARSYSSC